MNIQYSIANPVEPVSPVRAKGLIKRREERKKGKKRKEGRKEGREEERERKKEKKEKGRTRRAVVREGLLAERDLGSVLLLKYRVAVGNSIDDRV